jgi:hypothetical protein
MGNLQAARSFFIQTDIVFDDQPAPILLPDELNLMIFSISKVDCLRLSVDLVSYLNLIFLKNSHAILL